MNHRTRIILRYLFVILLGVFFHFSYELSGENPIVGLFTPVNESVWEHLKLVFFPLLILTIWDLFTHRGNNLSFLPARTIGILSALAFTIITFYTITGVIGTNIDWINILNFLLAIVLAFLIEKKLSHKCLNLSIALSILILVLFVVLFIVFTIAPPALGIFIPMGA